MRLTNTLAVIAFAALAAAQNPTLVNAAGSPFATGTVSFPVELPTSYSLPLALASDGKVFMALDPTTPTGYYMFDVVDVNFTGLSQLPASDRIFFAQNNGPAGFAITRLNPSPSLPPLGAGLGGVGQSMPVFPFNSPLPIATRPDLTCVQKVQLYSLGSTATGTPAFTGFEHFRVGDGSPGAVSGVVFEDSDHDGVRDVGAHSLLSTP